MRSVQTITFLGVGFGVYGGLRVRIGFWGGGSFKGFLKGLYKGYYKEGFGFRFYGLKALSLGA